MTLSPEQLARLPKFAQQEIGRLERSVEHWKGKAAAGPEDSDTFADRIVGALDDFPGRPLGRGTSVSFQYGEGERDSVDVRVQHGWVELHASGGDLLIICPLSTNGARCRVVPEH